MDTVLLSPRKMEKTATSAAGVTIAICLLISQNLTISAKDIYSGNKVHDKVTTDLQDTLAKVQFRAVKI